MPITHERAPAPHGSVAFGINVVATNASPWKIIGETMCSPSADPPGGTKSIYHPSLSLRSCIDPEGNARTGRPSAVSPSARILRCSRLEREIVYPLSLIPYHDSTPVLPTSAVTLRCHTLERAIVSPLSWIPSPDSTAVLPTSAVSRYRPVPKNTQVSPPEFGRLATWGAALIGRPALKSRVYEGLGFDLSIPV